MLKYMFSLKHFQLLIVQKKEKTTEPDKGKKVTSFLRHVLVFNTDQTLESC